MDLLAMYQSRANAPLDAMAKLCGFPGKLGMDGSQVYGAYLEGRRDEIRRYCETDAMNTYLLWCRFEKMRGHLDEAGYRREIGIARDTVAAIGEPHWQEYLAAWPAEEARAGEGSSTRRSAAAAAPAVEESPPARRSRSGRDRRDDDRDEDDRDDDLHRFLEHPRVVVARRQARVGLVACGRPSRRR